jgi:hypothetical protein
LSQEAGEAFRAFFQDTEGKIGSGREWDHAASFVSKIRSNVARLAAVLHMCDDVDVRELFPVGDEIDLRTMERAIVLGNYYLAHGLAAYAAMATEPAKATALHLWAVIVRLARGGEAITVRALHRASEARFPKVKDVHDALETLVEAGYLRVVKVPPAPKGGRASEVVEVSPAAKAAAKLK